MDKKVLDVCCGPKGMWFDKNDERALYLDIRSETFEDDGSAGYKKLEISPDIIGSFTDIKQPDNSFHLVVFDPPHIKQKADGEIVRRYGKLDDDWQDMISKGFKECFRVLKPNGTLIFKWCEVRFSIKEVLKLTPHKPLFGHKSGKRMNTHWVCFIK